MKDRLTDRPVKNTRWVVALLIAVGLSGVSCTKRAEETDSVAQRVSGTIEQVRSWHFVLRSVSLERAHWMVDRAHDADYNMIVVTVTDGVRLDHAPWRPLPDAWSKDELRTWVRYARSKGIAVVPEIKLLTHQQSFFQNHQPDLMFNAASYDPRQERTYKLVVQLLDEIITLIHPGAIHIGHDEVAGHNVHSMKKLIRAGEQMLPADLFLKDTLYIYDYLKSRDVETWMWGDMLISPDEFPTMLAKHLHGTAPGYGKVLRDKLPRDIVICDWHYFDNQKDFPSLTVMQKEGFRVIGSTWKKPETIRNFNRYAAQHGAYGMMTTTWFHVQRKEWDVMNRIIRESGSSFLNSNSQPSNNSHEVQ